MSESVDVEHFMGRVIALDSDIVELKREFGAVRRLAHNVELLAYEVRQLGLRMGVSIPVPSEWEEITQVKRPELQKLRRRARRGPALGGAGVAIGWAVVELLRAIAEGRIHLP